MKWLETIAEAQRDAAREAATSATIAVDTIQKVFGGASGALTYRLGSNGSSYLLRLETRRSPIRNPHQYTCMRIAAEAGIAPPLRYADDGLGVSIMDFVEARPLAAYPDGPLGLAEGLGQLAAKLQETEPFPVLADYRMVVERMMERVKNQFVPGLLDRHLEGFARIKAAYPWDSAHVSAHNDPNPRNILFDGKRLWLIDWETAYRNDPLTDIAVLTQNMAVTPELEDALLRAWLGREPDRELRYRLVLMRQMTRLYYAGLLLAMSTSSAAPVTDLAAPTPIELRKMAASGTPGDPAIMLALGKTCLAAYLSGLEAPEFVESLKQISRSG